MKGKRLQVTINEDFYDVLHELAEKQGLSVGELIRRSVSLQGYIREMQASGETLIFRNKSNNTEREVVTLWRH